MARLSIAQLNILRMIADRRVSMFCDKCVWHHRAEGETINRRTIQSLENAGWIVRSYFSDGAAVNLTDKGRARIAEWDKNRRKVA